jgi:non-specific serine/threonine protein kinase
VCAELVEGLLLACPNLRVLATSREVLGVPGETVYQVPTLSLPDLEQPLDQGNLEHSEAAQLFIERARLYQPGFQVEGHTAEAIAQICLLLDGIPLAIELAAARVRLLSPAQIVDHLKDSLNYLATGGRTVVSRQQTLLASLEWSYDLLGEREQMLFRRLAVFAGRFILQDVEAVCAGGLDPVGREDVYHGLGDFQAPLPVLQVSEIFGLLSNLVDKSLLLVTHDQEAIYRMLIPIKHFAREMLSESGEIAHLRHKHLYHYLDLAEVAAPELMKANQSVWFNRLETEHDNLRAALAWSLEVGSLKIGVRLASALGHFWFRRGYISEGVEWLDRLLNMDHPTDLTQARGLIVAGDLNYEYGNYTRAKSFAEQGLKLCEKFQNQEGIAHAHYVLGLIEHMTGDRQEGIRHLKDSLALFREMCDDWYVALTLLRLGDAQMRVGDHRQAADSFRKGLTFFRKIGDNMGTAFALGGLGDLARLRGDYDLAKSYFQESLTLRWFQGKITGGFWVLEALAILAVEQNKYEEAAILWGSGFSLRETFHTPLPPSYAEDYAPYLAAARAALGGEAFQDTWERGYTLDLEQVYDIVLERRIARPGESPSPSSISTDIAQQYGLTRREVEVLRLVASGLTSPQVAEKLVISPRTVSKHLESIYGKIQVNSRSAATRFALEHNIA